jgi:RHS repeat-associated protein
VLTNSGNVQLQIVALKYDAFGQLVEQDFTANSQTTITTYERDASGNIVAEYTNWQTTVQRRLSADINGQTQVWGHVDATGAGTFDLTDHLGSVIQIVNASESSVDQLTYDVWGNLTAQSSPQPGWDVGFAGGLYLSALGLTNDDARFTGNGRWLTKDPTGLAAGPNPYAYANNAPTNEIDPSGLSPTTESTGGPGSSGFASAAAQSFVESPLEAAMVMFQALGYMVDQGGGYLLAAAIENWNSLPPSVQQSIIDANDAAKPEQAAATLVAVQVAAGSQPRFGGPRPPDPTRGEDLPNNGMGNGIFGMSLKPVQSDVVQQGLNRLDQGNNAWGTSVPAYGFGGNATAGQSLSMGLSEAGAQGMHVGLQTGMNAGAAVPGPVGVGITVTGMADQVLQGNGKRVFKGLLIAGIFGLAYHAVNAAGTPAPKGVQVNKAAGDAWERELIANELPKTQSQIQPQITIKSKGPSGMKSRVDAVGTDSTTGAIKLTDGKASPTAPLQPNQKVVYPELEKYGGVVVGEGKPPYVGGTQIPPTGVDILRKP